MEETITGLTINTSFTIDPTRHDAMGNDAFICQDTDYSGGQGARVTGPSQEIFRFPAGEDYAPIDSFSGNMLLELLYASDYMGDVIVLEVHTRDSVTGETFHDPDTDVIYSQVGQGLNITSIRAFFDYRNEYKFIFKTTPQFNGTYVDIDLAQFTKNDNNSFSNWSGYQTSPKWAGYQRWIEYGEIDVPYVSGAMGQIDISFGAKFVTPPHITLTGYAGVIDDSYALEPLYKNVTTSGFTIKVIRPDGKPWSGSTSVMWEAKGSILPHTF